MRHTKRPRPGAALLEVMVALATLVIAGAGMTSLVMQTVETVRNTARRDREIRQAGGDLNRALLWTSTELAARVGRSRTNCCMLDVTRESSTLYRIVLADTTTGSTVLETTIYASRP